MIYIATHKKFEEPKLDGYCVLQVGAEGKPDFGYIRDNIGDHISAKNPNYCELTGLYWIWKNCNDDYKGLVHYRRYFGSRKKIFSYNRMLQTLQKGYDIVLPYTEYFLQNAKDEILIACCTDEIFHALRKCIQKLYPEYLLEFDLFFKGNKCSLFNMLFCKKEWYDKYCNWLFDILFELEKNISLENLNKYQKRIYGFLAERLLNIWVEHNHLKVVRLKVVNTEMSFKDTLVLKRRRCTNRLRFFIKKIRG